MKSDMYMNSKMILLTPLLKFDSIFETLLMIDHSSFIVIGEKDAHYIPSRPSDRVAVLVRRITSNKSNLIV